MTLQNSHLKFPQLFLYDSNMRSTLQSWAHWLTKHEVPILLLCFQFLLRIPNLFEPYWYGDEGIYLTIGVALRNGAKLYAGIIDHKTPLIYYFAMVPSQVWFRILLIAWTSISTLCFYLITKALKFPPVLQILSTILFILLTTLPMLEGNIPNGELFVMGFVMMAVTLLIHTTQVEQLFANAKQFTLSKNFLVTVFVVGNLFGLATLLKVPAVVEIFPIGMLGLLALLQSRNQSDIFQRGKNVLVYWFTFGIGLIIPIACSVLYFWAQGSLNDYLQFGLLYNFKYTQEWGLPFSHPLLVSLFSLKGKAAVLAGFSALIVLGNRFIRPHFFFVSSWMIAALFASILSSRPYPHYLLQLVPASILMGMLIFHTSRKYFSEVFFVAITAVLIVGTVKLLNFGSYPTIKYYQDFWQYVTKRITKEEYDQRFNWLMKDNTAAAPILQTAEKSQIFIWGTNPMLYALSQTYPVGRFTVAFHIADFPGAFQETYLALVNNQPEFIVIMKGETIEFPEFFQYVSQFYIPYETFENFTIYKRTSISNL